MTPMKAIRSKCLDCMCGNRAEVRRCPCENCPLFPYRMGHKPKQGSDTPDSINAVNPPQNPTVERREGAKASPPHER